MMPPGTTGTARAWGRFFLAWNLYPVPVPRKKKAPMISGWPSLRLTPADVDEHFTDEANIGILNGLTTTGAGGFIDIDLDDPGARAMAHEFLPPTKWRYGRSSSPESHWGFVATPVIPTKKFADPEGVETTLVEYRSIGTHTLAPGSTHPESNEVYRFDGEPGAPTRLAARDLLNDVICLACAALLLRHWPGLGTRHDTACAAAGFLLRQDVSDADVLRIVCQAAKRGGQQDHRADVRSTIAKFHAGQDVTGSRTLVTLLTGEGARTVAHLRHWTQDLQRRGPRPDARDVETGNSRFGGPPPPTLDPEPPVSPPATKRPVTLPDGFIRDYVEAAQRRTDAPAEAHTLAAVIALSALAGPRLRLPLAHRRDGMRLVLWGMNVVDSTGGRKTTVNELALDVIRRTLGEEAILPWQGSPEAFIQSFAARDGQSSVFARDEYSGLLAMMKRGGYVAGLTQNFIRAFDGLPIVMARVAKKKKDGAPVDDTDRVLDPFLVKLCAATRTSFLEVASIEDVLDGLLARFTFTTGTAEERPMARMTPAVEDAWSAVLARARDFHARGQALQGIALPDEVLQAEWDLEQRLKALAGAHPRPDAARPALKRLAETVIKVAALLSLENALGEATVGLDHFDAAAVLASPWITTTLGLIADLGRTKFQARCDAVLATIRARPEGIARRPLYRAHRGLNSREFDEVCLALDQQGYIEETEIRGTKGGNPTFVYKARG